MIAVIATTAVVFVVVAVVDAVAVDAVVDDSSC